MIHIVVTGANGFVGSAVVALLQGHYDVSVTGWVRTLPQRSTDSPAYQVMPDLCADAAWPFASLPHAADVVIHTAARVHVMDEQENDPLAVFRAANTAGTLSLARQAAAAGVRRFVFVSSVKVNGEGTDKTTAYSPESVVAPQDPYAISKWEAEQGLRQIERETGMEVVVVRPPLVYGPCVGANFLRLLRVVRLQRWLPLAAIDNRRSLVFIGNLVDAIAVCAKHPAAAGKTYLVSDGEDVSTPELIRRIAQALSVRPRLLPISPQLMRLCGRILGRQHVVERLISSLVVDSAALQKELGWTPPYTMADGLRMTAEWFDEAYSNR